MMANSREGGRREGRCHDRRWLSQVLAGVLIMSVNDNDEEQNHGAKV